MRNRKTMNKRQSTTSNQQSAISNYSSLIAYCLLLLVFTACSTTKHIPEGDALYTGATVKLINAENVSKPQKKVLNTDLTGLTRPKPNGRFLGIPFKLILWNMFYTTKEKGLKAGLQRRLGEPPVLASTVNLNANTTLLQNHLQNKGFFGAAVTADSTWKNKKASVTYTANAGPQYHIASVQFSGDSSGLTNQIVEIGKQTLLKVGAPYDLDLIKGERERIDALLKERGYFYFSPEYLLAQVDSTNGKHEVAMKMIVKPNTPEQAKEAYYINDVYVYSDYSLNTARADTSRDKGQLYGGYHVIDPRGKFKPKLFTNVMTFQPNELYNRTDHNKTLQRLMNLNVFKFVKNRFERVPVDSPKLDAFYYLTPMPEKALRAEIGANTRSNNLNGSEISIGFTHRNTFRAGEQMDFRIYGGTEAQFSGSFSGISTFRVGGEINFAIPRFVVPFFNLKSKSAYVPRTNIQLGYEALNRKTLYTLNSFHGGIGYLWRESPIKSHELYPISITYAQPLNINPAFKAEVDTSFALQHIIDTQFVLGSTYQLNINQLAAGYQKTNSFYFNFLGDISGNIAGLLVNGSGPDGKRLFDLPFSQYLKFEIDGRYYRKLGLNNTWANRIILGYGLPYGNSRELPYIKQFFAGGNNSIRAFRSRTLGPGSYLARPNPQGYIPDQTGDIKIELNTELRPRISGPLYGALFIDAGNIWLANSNPYKPGGEFGKEFLKQFAVGAGVGIRLDIQLFVIRFDAAFPVRDPSRPVGDRMLKGVSLNEAVYNLAIGYPF